MSDSVSELEPQIQGKEFLRLLDSENPNLRRAACLLLAEHKTSGCLGAIGKLVRDRVWQVRQAAAIALGRLGNPQIVDSLLSRLSFGEVNARAAILELLAQTAQPADEAEKEKNGILGGAQRASSGDREDKWEVRQALALAVARLQPDLIHEPLLHALASEQPNVRIAAASGLSNLRDPEMGEKILPLCEDADPQVQRAAAVALGKMKYAGAAQALIQLLDSKHAAVRLEAVIALNHLKIDEAYEPLLARAEDPDSRVRKAAVLAVGNSRREEGVEKVAATLADESPEVRAAACQALLTLKAREKAGQIAPLLLDESTDVANAAALSYQQLVG